MNVKFGLIMTILILCNDVYVENAKTSTPNKINLPVDYTHDPLKDTSDKDNDIIDDISVKMLLKDDKLDKICSDENNQFYVGLEEQNKFATGSNKAMNGEINEVQKFKKNMKESNKPKNNINPLVPTFGFRLPINPDKNTPKGNSN
ncbi:hypothetical protein RFI_32298 [Reticulomyxa filosa]|uniref:Fam-b protein n=1 Tax=Reticulomyxa filosa TaxID=46433 RepID=X6LVC2_RETFI|nr:hypothetical protein RFI_32298 [Reticulomyxa filosa]|eukprot:ETO05097.1 hypothetical protein RFI_32298 [Reticulomyxa filosa]